MAIEVPTTPDAFRVLRRFCYELGLPPQVRYMPQRDAAADSVSAAHARLFIIAVHVLRTLSVSQAHSEKVKSSAELALWDLCYCQVYMYHEENVVKYARRWLQVAKEVAAED